MRRSALIAMVAAAGLAVGLAAELVSDASASRAAADLATGWTLLACGLWGHRHRPGELRWLLVAAAGIAWFGGNFADADSAAVSSAGAALIYLHRGPLVHATVARAGSRSVFAVLAVAAGYASALITGSGNAQLTVGAAILLAAFAIQAVARSGVRMGRPELLAAGSQLALAVGLMLAGATALADVSPRAADATLFGYEAALVGSALLLMAVPRSELRARTKLADLVVELGPARRSQTVREALRRALGDPTLEVGYWLAAAQRYVDLEGRPVQLPSPDSGRAATLVESDGERIAALVHDASVLDDESLVEAVQEATMLVLANARLEAEVGMQLGELRASRQRIVQARDEQRRRLARRLTDGAGRRLGEVAEAVGRAGSQWPPGEQDVELFELIEQELAHARDEVSELARGVHPRVLTERGLAAALSELADRAGGRVELQAPVERLPAPLEAAVYFLCSEAFANVAKYARASRVRCEVTRADGQVNVTVVDDGVGGADAGHGSGLRGLADRIEALGGSFDVASPPGAGTTVRAELPLDGAQSAV
jgi:signal transduction histidine kinase